MSGAHAHPGHHHGHHHHTHGDAGNGDWRYGLAIVLNLGFVVLEAAFGILSNSTALLADAGHNLSDVLSLVLAGGAAWLARRQGAERRTYGFGKATILAALTNAVVLIFACGAIALEAIQRFSTILNSPAAMGYELLVAGHTDSTPVVNQATISKGHKDNWYLSSHRAIAVGQDLISNRVSAQRMGMVGYADQRPAGSNASESGKSANRRVEVLILPTTIRGNSAWVSAIGASRSTSTMRW